MFAAVWHMECVQANTHLLSDLREEEQSQALTYQLVQLLSSLVCDTQHRPLATSTAAAKVSTVAAPVDAAASKQDAPSVTTRAAAQHQQ